MFDPNSFDPSKLDPKTLMELSQLIRELPPAQLNRMQSIMHNMMAGFDVRKEMEDFEKSLPPGFRERLVAIMSRAGVSAPGMTGGAPPPPMETTARPVSPEPAAAAAPEKPMDMRSARITVLRAVSEGKMSPEEAERLLFPE